MKISVILTTCNAEKTIQRTLNSILSQDGQNRKYEMELIVVDDASTDKTPFILQENKIQYITNATNSGGPNKGRNIGLQKATGDFICICDHDDIWHRQKLSRQIDYCHAANIITCGYELADHKIGKKRIRSHSAAVPVQYPQNSTFRNVLSRSYTGQTVYLSTIMFHKDLKQILFEERFGMLDYDWLLRIFENQTSLELPDILVERYVDGSNLSLHAAYRKNDYYYSLYTLEAYEEKYSELTKLAAKRINGSRARYHYLMNDMKQARRYFRRSRYDLKVLSYYLTSFFGSSYVRRHFSVFG
jgi:glycosyltransferase involved in cell wall biosynthesis